MELCRFDKGRVTFGGVAALDGLSFAIDSDAGVTGIIGPNGAGKSTTLNALTGAVRLSGGAAYLLGHQVDKRANPAVVARWGVGRTFQTPRPFARMTVRENFRAASEAQQIARWGNRKRLHQLADDMLDRLSLTGIADKPAGGASLAERKRIELGKALATEPTVVLLDEMFEGLSEAEISQMIATLRQLSAEGVYFIFIEHVMRALRSLADNLLVLDKGKLIASGRTAEVLQDERVRRAYLGMAAVQASTSAAMEPAVEDDQPQHDDADSARKDPGKPSWRQG